MSEMLHIAAREANTGVWSEVFRQALGEFGNLTIIENGEQLSDEEAAERIRQCDVLLTGWGMRHVPASLAHERGRLGYICHVTGGMRDVIPLELIEAGIPVTNWGDAPANGVAEGAMTLLLATMKDLHHQIENVRDGSWEMDMRFHGGSLEGRNVGVYGFGVIARRFVELLRPFGAVIRVFDPYVGELDGDLVQVASLEELFERSEIIVIHAGLTEETRGAVTGALLAKLPRHGIVINTARGGIIDQEALFRELENGRLRAGLDVLEPDWLPYDHPARRWENLILSTHRIEYGWPADGLPPKTLSKMQRICLENLRRWQKGEPLRFTMDATRYLRST